MLEIIKVSNTIFNAELLLMRNHLFSGNVIVCPTDTIYGLSCMANNKEAINKIFIIKKRNLNKPLLILINSWEMLEEYCEVSEAQKQYLQNIWPGAVTVVLKHKQNLPNNLTANLETIAVRWPKLEWLQELITQVNVPLLSTSVNLESQPSLLSVDNLDAYFVEEKPDVVFNAGLISGQASRLINLTDLNNIKKLR